MNEAALPATTDPRIKVRLFVMMFLQYFVQGSYLPIASVYLQDALGFDGYQIGLFGSALAVGPLLAPFVVGQLVDRHLATERVLAFCHLAAGVVMLVLFLQTKFAAVFTLGTIYSVLYVPTMMLTNALAFHHLRNRDREFPTVRLWGTIGFVVPAWLIELYWLRGLSGADLDAARGVAFWLSGVAGVVMALYCLTLPHTPPQPGAAVRYAPGAVVALLRRRDFQVLVAVSFVIAICHKFYFVWNSPFLKWFLRSGDITGAMEQRLSSIGQISEVVVMAGLGMAVVRIGFKRTLALGALAYLLRCLIFAGIEHFTGPYEVAMGLVCTGQALHGFCFGCFWAASYIYVDRVAPTDIRGSMQMIYGTFVFSLGMFIGGFLSGGVGELFTTGSGEQAVRNWSGIWLTCAGLAAISLLAFQVLFPSKESEQ